MKSRLVLLAILVVITVAGIVYVYKSPQEASMLLTNGIVYTVNDDQPTAEAIAISGDRIVGVGTNAEMLSSFKPERVLDLKGKPVFPGFIDSHAHMENLGAFLMNLNLVGTNSIEEVQKLVAQRSKGTHSGSWIRGRGWDQNRWPLKVFPARESLDEVAGGLPVYLTRVDGHVVWVSTRVLELAGITRETPDPPGGRIVRDSNGEPTGIFIDNAIDSLDARIPEPSLDERTEAVDRAVKTCIEMGLTGVHDMGVDLAGIEIYRQLIARNRFPFQVYIAINGVGKAWEHYLETGPEIGGMKGRMTVRAIKIYSDGALGSRGAALIEPYSDDKSNRGLTLTSTETMSAVARSALENGFQMCTHAIGDRANHIVLNVYENTLNSNEIKRKDARFRVEHAQVIALDDIPRFQKIGVLPVMQQTHCTSDMYWAEARLGPKRVKGAYAWRSLLEHGSIIPGGSDFPVESPNPLWGFYAAVTRKDHSGWPDGGWHAEQVMTRDEALKSFTIWAAYAAFEEGIKGSIEKGKLADLVVLSDDIMKITPEKVLQTNVETTIIRGEVVFSRDVGAPQ